ncbi:MAG: adenylate/guanylate cyclase domain-containing protein, partial [Solimonas sp.]
GHDPGRRTERALVAWVRQELSAPAMAVMGYAEMMLEDAARGEDMARAGDLRRILDASQAVHRLILGLLDPAVFQRHEGSADLDEFRRTLRHDLRTPINAIKGYGEMLREDAAGDGATAFVADLDKMLGEAALLLARIDGLVTWSDGRTLPSERSAGGEGAAPAGMVESLLQSVRSVRPDEADLAAAIPSRILVVDDNASNRDLLVRRLQRQGHAVLQAEDGARALAMIESEPLDLVLLDLMMPGISGYEVLTRLKADPRHRDLPVIMISALSELDSVVRCIEAGADDYLAKPFEPTLLRARVGSSLEKKHMRDREHEMLEALRAEKERSEQLLLNILPQAIVTRLNGGAAVIADHLPDVTILFADLVDFTRIASGMKVDDLVRMLNGLFSEFDRLAIEHGVEKIKTAGDNYMLAGGLPDPCPDHACVVADMAFAMLAALERTNRNLPVRLEMRIGIHSGEVVAGVIGTHKFVYDVWGDAVNVASRMESH